MPATGVYNGNNNTLELKNGISIETDHRLCGHDRAGGRRPRQGQSVARRSRSRSSAKEGTLRADSMDVADRGKHIVFRGGVSVTFMPPDKLATAPEAE